MTEPNTCKTCNATDGRAGILINGDCLNCHKTRETGSVQVHTNLPRTPDEILATIAIIHD
jgi:hypothetical protein